MVWVKDTATVANDTLDMTCPRAWQSATGVNSNNSSLSIGWLQKKTILQGHTRIHLEEQRQQVRNWYLQHVWVDQHPKKQDSIQLQLEDVQQKQNCRKEKFCTVMKG